MVRIYIDLRRPADTKRKLKNYARKIYATTDVTHKAVFESNGTLARRIIKKSKELAPKWTGYLKSTIRFDKQTYKKRKSAIFVKADAPYAAAQELGYKPHYLGASAFTRNPIGGKKYFANWMADKGILGPGAAVKRYTPFMRPAVTYVMSIFKSTYNRKVGTALKKHFR